MESKRRRFKAEVQQVLDLVIHSLYTNRDIFLRELISNASDAIDRARFESVSKPEILEGDDEWKIRLIPDKENNTLTVSDNGIGMSMEEMDTNIGTIAGSGTRRFLEELQRSGGKAAPELIGQFGVGFYSAFMVADKVTVISRRAGDPPDAATRWESAGAGAYTLTPCTKETRGTDVILHLREDAKEYLEPWRIEKIVKTYSDFVEHPIVLVTRDDKGKETEEILNSRRPLWTRPRDEIEDKDYNEFYRHISHDFLDPLKVIHWHAEGVTEFDALLFIPRKAFVDVLVPDRERTGLQLYVRRVFITDRFEGLIPSWLRFVRGVVETDDLPLNISRETLQDSRLIQVIRKNVVRKVLDTLEEMLKNERETYEEFWKEFGRVLKEGIHLDLEWRERLQDLLLFESSALEAGRLTTLAEYLERASDEQEAIYVIAGENRATMEKSPHLEALVQRGVEVLFMTDPIDEWVLQSMPEYKEHPIRDVSRGEFELPGESAEQQEAEEKALQAEFGPLLGRLKDVLKDKVRDVRMSRRLKESACCLVTDENDPGVQMEKVLKAIHRELPAARRILELNPDHPLVRRMRDLQVKDPKHPKVAEYGELLYEQARLTAGLPVEEPVRLSRRLSELLAAEAAQSLEGAS